MRARRRARVKAERSEPPECAKRFSHAKLRLLVGLCWELQKAHGERPFFLSCIEVGKRLGIHYKRANAWLHILRTGGVLEVAARPARRAIRYRFVGEV